MLKPALAFVCFVCLLTTVHADILNPVGLEAGDQYRIAFITNGTNSATDPDIAFYDTFVTGQALIGSQTQRLTSATWQVIGSTATVNANGHTGTLPSNPSVPIYLVDGATRIANGNSDLWDLSLQNPLNLDQNGATLNGIVFTGTGFTGNRRTDRYFGADTYTTIGDSSVTNAAWVSIGGPNQLEENTNTNHFYAISNIQTVAIPEPNAIWILLLAFTIVFSEKRCRVLRLEY